MPTRVRVRALTTFSNNKAWPTSSFRGIRIRLFNWMWSNSWMRTCSASSFWAANTGAGAM